MVYIANARNRRYVYQHRGGSIGSVLVSLASKFLPVLKTGARSLIGMASNKLKDKEFHAVSVRNSFKLKWKPVFNMMEMCPDLDIPAEVDEAFVQSSFKQRVFENTCFLHLA